MTNQSISNDSEILMAQPRGFCAGVDRAINIVEEALSRFA
jgi:4-hydroxy-3-methylbut-2-enyl diphosphate reductase